MGKRLKKPETIQAWKLDKVKNKEVSGSTKNKSKVHFASLMELCHLKNATLEPKFQKYKGRVVFQVDIVIDDSGACAVFY